MDSHPIYSKPFKNNFVRRLTTSESDRNIFLRMRLNSISDFQKNRRKIIQFWSINGLQSSTYGSVSAIHLINGNYSHRSNQRVEFKAALHMYKGIHRNITTIDTYQTILCV